MSKLSIRSDAHTLNQKSADPRGRCSQVLVLVPELTCLDAGKTLVVSTSGFGTDNIDISAATEREIFVVSHRGSGRVPVSEHAISLAFEPEGDFLATPRLHDRQMSFELADSAVDQIVRALRGIMPTWSVNRLAWEGLHSRRPKVGAAEMS